jgi:uncharacterized protein (DUF58 family)
VQLIRRLYFTRYFYYALAGATGLFLLAFIFPALLLLAKVLAGVLALLVVVDVTVLFHRRQGLVAQRSLAEKLSNGSDNPVCLHLENRYAFPVRAEVIDELPFQFQQRDVSFRLRLSGGENHLLEYVLRPVRRGLYHFGAINVFVCSPLQLARRRYRIAQDQAVPVYPSFIQMRHYELLAASRRLSELGIKQVRQPGHSREFEQIQPYVAGDDPRAINWQATARKGELMVNHYQDEKSQQVYCLIDKGRVMQMPFEGLSLLDYAINAALVIANIALKKQDKAGIVTFAETTATILPAEGKASQLQKILDLLYNQKTRFLETDFEKLYTTLRARIHQRSLLVLFTNFETLNGAQRQLPSLRQLARHHLLLVVFFENVETRALLEKPAINTEEIYLKAIAEKFAYEKRQIVKELARHGIQSILTPPEKLTVNTINKYLEFKARGVI